MYVFAYFKYHKNKRPDENEENEAGRSNYANFDGIFYPTESMSLNIIGFKALGFFVFMTPMWTFLFVYFSGLTSNKLAMKLVACLGFVTTILDPLIQISFNWKFRFLLRKLLKRRSTFTIAQLTIARKDFVMPKESNYSLTKTVSTGDVHKTLVKEEQLEVTAPSKEKSAQIEIDHLTVDFPYKGKSISQQESVSSMKKSGSFSTDSDSPSEMDVIGSSTHEP